MYSPTSLRVTTFVNSKPLAPRDRPSLFQRACSGGRPVAAHVNTRVSPTSTVTVGDCEIDTCGTAAVDTNKGEVKVQVVLLTSLFHKMISAHQRHVGGRGLKHVYTCTIRIGERASETLSLWQHNRKSGALACW